MTANKVLSEREAMKLRNFIRSNAGLDKKNLADTAQHYVNLASRAVAKWERIASGNGSDEKFRNCSFCLDTIGQNNGNVSCYDCPIYAITGSFSCKGTPYEEWESLNISSLDPSEIKKCTEQMINDHFTLMQESWPDREYVQQVTEEINQPTLLEEENPSSRLHLDTAPRSFGKYDIYTGLMMDIQIPKVREKARMRAMDEVVFLLDMLNVFEEMK